MDCLGLGAREAAHTWERGVRGEDGLVPPRVGGSRGGADPVLPLLTLKSRGWKRSCGSPLPSPSRHLTVNRSRLGEAGKGEGVRCSTCLALSEAARAAHTKSTRAITDQPPSPTGTKS